LEPSRRRRTVSVMASLGMRQGRHKTEPKNSIDFFLKSAFDRIKRRQTEKRW
jgi:hypothetical protein